MGYKFRDCLDVAIELVDELLVISSPLPGDKLSVLSTCNKGLIIVEDEQVSDEVFLDEQLVVLANEGALFDVNEVLKLVEADTQLVPSYYEVVDCVDLEALDPLVHAW